MQQEYTHSPESLESGRYHVSNRDHDETEEGPEALPPLRPNRRKGDDIELGSQKLTEYNLSKHNNVKVRNVNPMVSNYISPIGQFSLSLFVTFSDTGTLQILRPIRTKVD